MKYIEEWAFANCSSLKSINIPDSIESVEKGIFNNCKSLEEVIFEGKTLDEVKLIDYYPWDADPNIIKA